MYYALMMFYAMDYPMDHPDRVAPGKALRKFIVEKETDAFTVTCQSPVWDTSLAIEALLETEELRAIAAAEKGVNWLMPLQTLDVKGDWAKARPNLRPGGWCFFYFCQYFPDVDSTGASLQAIHKLSVLKHSDKHACAFSRGMEWLIGMQSKNGGWGAWDVDHNNFMYLKNISVADRGSFLDHPLVDCNGNILVSLAQYGQNISNSEAVRRAVNFLYSKQEPNRSWFAQWGINYIYGTIVKAVHWILSIQNPDGGWGEHVDSYKGGYKGHVLAPSTASQTSWCLFSLMKAVDITHPAITAGVNYLLNTQHLNTTTTGQWYEEEYAGTGRPEILYVRYNGYSKYFPLYVLAMYWKKIFAKPQE